MPGHIQKKLQGIGVTNLETDCCAVATSLSLSVKRKGIQTSCLHLKLGRLSMMFHPSPPPLLLLVSTPIFGVASYCYCSVILPSPPPPNLSETEKSKYYLSKFTDVSVYRKNFKKSKNQRFDGIHINLTLKYLSIQEFKREFPDQLYITNNVNSGDPKSGSKNIMRSEQLNFMMCTIPFMMYTNKAQSS